MIYHPGCFPLECEAWNRLGLYAGIHRNQLESQVNAQRNIIGLVMHQFVLNPTDVTQIEKTDTQDKDQFP